ncbi:LysR family transcriptional regulator [Antarcticirhabdus aurantiaca]|uniref:LysR family transcriptional regulator n=1 Tax=Antarcticirhabdus aurantiaca TaxID=2606717 RepID=UPI00131AAEBE|nr:LysR family transcriptional regulator [Antarcticirhabdus aurantiaca]
MEQSISKDLGRQASERRTRTFAGHVTLHKLEVFCAVAHFSSVTRAAEHLAIAQPAVTAHVRGLERSLDTTLVRRIGRHIELTEAGECVYRWAGDMIASSAEMTRELSGLEAGVSGSAVVGASMVAGTYVLPDVLVRFHRQFPDAVITTSISNPRVAMESVRSGDCDFSVAILDRRQNTEDLVLEHLWTEPLRLVAAPDTRRIGTIASREDLAELPYIAPPPGQIARDVEDEALKACGIVRRNIALEFGHPEPILHAVRADVGVSFSFESALREDLRRGTLRVVETPGVAIGIPLYLIRRRNRRLSLLQRRLMDAIRAAYHEFLLSSGGPQDASRAGRRTSVGLGRVADACRDTRRPDKEDDR